MLTTLRFQNFLHLLRTLHLLSLVLRFQALVFQAQSSKSGRYSWPKLFHHLTAIVMGSVGHMGAVSLSKNSNIFLSKYCSIRNLIHTLEFLCKLSWQISIFSTIHRNVTLIYRCLIQATSMSEQSKLFLVANSSKNFTEYLQIVMKISPSSKQTKAPKFMLAKMQSTNHTSVTKFTQRVLIHL